MAYGNPNPSRITDPMWRGWVEFKKRFPNARLGGIFAHTYGYHSDQDWLEVNDPDNYSIQLKLDEDGPETKAAAWDFTLSDADMEKVTRRMKNAVEHPEDDRLAIVRDWYGTLDGVNVFGYIHDGPGTPWRRASSDKSHLWHVHTSIIRSFINDWDRLWGVISVMVGVSWEDWKAGGNDMPLVPEDIGMIWEMRGVNDLLPAPRIDAAGNPHELDADGNPKSNPKWTPATYVRAILEEQRRDHALVRELTAGQVTIIAKLEGQDDGAIQTLLRSELDRAAALEAEARKAELELLVPVLAQRIAELSDNTLDRATVAAALRDVLGSIDEEGVAPS